MSLTILHGIKMKPVQLHPPVSEYSNLGNDIHKVFGFAAIYAKHYIEAKAAGSQDNDINIPEEKGFFSYIQNLFSIFVPNVTPTFEWTKNFANEAASKSTSFTESVKDYNKFYEKQNINKIYKNSEFIGTTNNIKTDSKSLIDNIFESATEKQEKEQAIVGCSIYDESEKKYYHICIAKNDNSGYDIYDPYSGLLYECYDKADANEMLESVLGTYTNMNNLFCGNESYLHFLAIGDLLCDLKVVGEQSESSAHE